jgi:gliding motility-associated-like protein
MKKLLLFLLMTMYSPLFAQQQEYQNLTLCDEDTLAVYTYSTNAGVSGTYFWSIDGNAPVIDGPSYDIVWGLYGEGFHTITVNFDDGIGCPAEPVSLNVNVEICATTTMWVPNCFTPDGDENNNEWKPIGTNYYDPYVFIVNRWGNLIFESYDINKGWDGTYGGNLCQDGIYIYVLRWRDWDGKSHQAHGHITLLR